MQRSKNAEIDEASAGTGVDDDGTNPCVFSAKSKGGLVPFVGRIS